jgi:excisionase family DNA binding protein
VADEILLTVREAARRLGIGRSLLYRLILEGQVLSVKIGRSRRIPVCALEEFAKKKVAEAAEDMDFRLQTLTLNR